MRYTRVWRADACMPGMKHCAQGQALAPCMPDSGREFVTSDALVASAHTVAWLPATSKQHRATSHDVEHQAFSKHVPQTSKLNNPCLQKTCT
jgi:hypothetical protein